MTAFIKFEDVGELKRIDHCGIFKEGINGTQTKFGEQEGRPFWQSCQE